MNNSLLKQYNKWFQDHDTLTVKYDQESRKSFYSFLNFETKGKKLLDIGCGSGHDLKHYQDSFGCEVYGIDASEGEVELANKRLKNDKVCVGYSYALPHADSSFDIVVSKYAAQTFDDIESFYKEVNRVLKPGGYFVLLVTHPMRHFLEKTKKPRDYFKKETVTSWIYDHTLPLQEITHTLNDYFSKFFFTNFILEQYTEEYDDISTEHIDGEKYPGYFILRARKK